MTTIDDMWRIEISVAIHYFQQIRMFIFILKDLVVQV